MSVIPEIVFQKLLVTGIKDARDDDAIFDILLPNLPAEVVDSLKEIFRRTDVHITISYPKQDPVFPLICILLRGEDESQAYLGDFLGEGFGPGEVDGMAEAGTTARGNSSSTIRPEFFYSEEVSPVEESAQAFPKKIMVGQPRKLFKRDNTLKKREGFAQEANYLVQIFAGSPELTIFLYSLVKYIFGRYRMTSENNGIVNITMSGTDFAPMPTYFPNVVYTRALSLGFTYWFDWFLEKGREGSLGYDPEGEFDLIAVEVATTGEETDTTIEQIALPQPMELTSITPLIVSVGVESIIVIEGSNIHNGATVEFDVIINATIALVEYISGNHLRVTFTAAAIGMSSVKVINPDLGTSTLTDTLSVIP